MMKIALIIIAALGIEFSADVIAAHAKVTQTPASPLVVPSPSVPQSEEFKQELERDFILRSIGDLNISNLRGSVTVHGWALDKIRVKATRKVTADSETEAKKLFEGIGFRYRTVEGEIELAVQYGKDLDIRQRIQEREKPKTSMDIVVYAPANLNLKLWTTHGAASLDQWNGSKVEIRSDSGAIKVDRTRSRQISLTCLSCEIAVADVSGSLRCLGNSGHVNLDRVTGPNLYVETTTGKQNAARVSGEQLYVSGAGAIALDNSSGRIEFHTREGAFHLKGGRGFLSGITASGDVDAEMKTWQPVDRALLETRSGNLNLSFPLSFSSEVDLWSIAGHVSLGFPSSPVDEPGAAVYGPLPENRIHARIAGGTDQLQVRSLSGDIRISKVH